MSNVQDPVDIPLYWLVDRDLYNGQITRVLVTAQGELARKPWDVTQNASGKDQSDFQGPILFPSPTPIRIPKDMGIV